MLILCERKDSGNTDCGAMSEFNIGGSNIPAELRAEVLNASMSFNTGGFGFENHHRNGRIAAELAKSNKQGSLPKAKLTGTTICGCIFKGGVVLGADTRATGGTEVVDKNCEKIHYLAPNIYCCGAGTAADTEKTTEMISGQASFPLHTAQTTVTVQNSVVLHSLLTRVYMCVCRCTVLFCCTVVSLPLHAVLWRRRRWIYYYTCILMCARFF